MKDFIYHVYVIRFKFSDIQNAPTNKQIETYVCVPYHMYLLCKLVSCVLFTRFIRIPMKILYPVKWHAAYLELQHSNSAASSNRS